MVLDVLVGLRVVVCLWLGFWGMWREGGCGGVVGCAQVGVGIPLVLVLGRLNGRV